MSKSQTSIRIKLFAIFVIMISAFEMILWLISANSLQFLFIYGKEMDMKDILSRYQADTQNLASGDLSNRDELLALMSYQWDGNLTVVDTETGVFRSTVPPMRDQRAIRGYFGNRGELLLNVARDFSSLPIGSVDSLITQDRNGKDDMVIIVARVNETQYLFSEKQLAVLNDSSNLVSRFIVISGLVLVLLGSIIVYFLSKGLTKNIIAIEHQAVRIANMDFKSHNTITQQDEIGSLARAVNQIASELEAAITSLSQANNQLQGEIEQERRMELTRRQFVSNVSHELKTPISMIMGYADGLKHGIVKSEEQKTRYYDVIISESEKMNQLIGDLLDMSAYQEGKLPIQNSSFDFSRLLEETLSPYLDKAEEQKITLLIDVKSPLMVYADPVRMNQVVVNLVSNAFKHVKDQGRIKIGCHLKEGNLALEVFNEGDWIPEVELDAIWMSFYRGAHSREKKIDGFGIGLALVKEIVEKHSGVVSVSNKEGGVYFSVLIPVTNDCITI